jgi:hypothetical protein
MSNLFSKLDQNVYAERVKVVQKKYNISEEEAKKYILSMGPKMLLKTGVLSNKVAWREGFTKKPMELRIKERRAKSKIAKQSRKQNRV